MRPFELLGLLVLGRAPTLWPFLMNFESFFGAAEGSYLLMSEVPPLVAVD
jgi:hypothetical protein